MNAIREILSILSVLLLASCGASSRSWPDPNTNPNGGPGAGTGAGGEIPPDAQLEDSTHPTTVVGKGTAESCTGADFVAAVAKGGVITFECGSDPVIIKLDQTAKIFNKTATPTNPKIVIDGGGKVTLSGKGAVRILYQNVCDQAQGWNSENCNLDDYPQLTVQNLTFVDGNATGQYDNDDGGGGGAIFVRGGRLKVINCRFFNNFCDQFGPDVGGGAVRTLLMTNAPAYVINSTFGGAEGYGNHCANGGALGSIYVSWTIMNSLFSYNAATGTGGNGDGNAKPDQGGSGGAIYNDGEDLTLSIYGSTLEQNSINAYGEAIFFVANDHQGYLHLENTTIRHNTDNDPSDAWTGAVPGVSMHDDTTVETIGCTLEN